MSFHRIKRKIRKNPLLRNFLLAGLLIVVSLETAKILVSHSIEPLGFLILILCFALFIIIASARQ